MIEAMPDGSLLVLDEAYIDLAPEGTAPEIDRRRSAGDPDAHLFQGLRHGGRAGRLCHRRRPS